MMVYPLKPWTWEEASIIKQLEDMAKPVSSVPDAPSPPPPEDQYHVTPIAYNTGYKPGQLIRINFPSSSEELAIQRTKDAVSAAEPPPKFTLLSGSAPNTVHISSFI